MFHSLLPFIGGLVLAVVGGFWRRSRIRARRRWRAALDAFARLQIDREKATKALR